MQWNIDLYDVITMIACILSLLVCVYTYRQKPSRCMTYFIISMFSIFFTCLISLFEISATTKEEALIAVQMGYVGRLVCMSFLAKFFMEYCHIFLSKWIEKAFLTVNILFITAVFTTDKTGLFYKSYDLTQSGNSVFFTIEPGVLYYPMLFEIYALLLSMFIFVIAQIKKKNDKEEKQKYMLMAGCIACPGVGLVVYMLFIDGGFDLMPCSLAVCSCMFFFAMRKKFLFDITQNGKDYVLDNAKEAVTIINGDNIVLYYNQATKQINPNAKLGEAILAGAKQKLSTENNKFEKNGLHFESVHTPLYREDGVLEGYLIEARDQTEYYRIIEDTKNFQEKALYAGQAKSDFLANMSHEIRTPINAILGMNEMILRENTNPYIEEYSTSIEKAGKALLSLVNDILDFSKMESGKIEYHADIYETKNLLLGCKENVEARYPGKRVAFHVQYNENLPKKLYGDIDGVRQLILNSVASAAEYISLKDAEIFFDFIGKPIVLRDYKRKEELENRSGDENRYPEIWLQMKINDVGQKISKEAFDKLFDHLNDGFESTKAQYERDELKPAIINKLMNQMKARLYMNLDEEGYVTTTLSIPQGVVDDQPMGKLQPEKRKMPGNTNGFEAPDAKILVVDDNVINLKVITALLKRTKIQVVAVNSGAECLELTKQIRFDLILMDHLMPEMDGIETLHRLKEQEEVQTPVIVLTANAVSGARESYMKEGFLDYLMKPIASENLEECLGRYLPKEKIIMNS